MEEWLPWAVFPAVLAAAFVSAHLTHRGRVRALRALAAGLEKGSADVQAGVFATLHDCKVEGRLDGREVRVAFEGHAKGESRYLAKLRLGVRHPAASFEVTDVGPLARLGRWLGLTQDPLGLLDREVRAEGPAGALLQATEVHTALRLLLALPGTRRVALGAEALEADVQVQGDLAALRPVLDAMAALARTCDRVPFSERADAHAARFAWTGSGGATARCPYCKDDLTAEAEVAGCPRCHTVHHRECLDEAGGCTVFGCGVKDQERARA